jgi:hypothetical protein
MYNSPGMDGVCKGYTRYIRMGGSWYSTGKLQGYEDAAGGDSESVHIVGEPIPKALIPPDWPPPGVVLWHFAQFNWQEESLSSSLLPYFPHVRNSRETYLYPCPGQPRFWAEYAERLCEFVAWAKNFHDVLLCISGFSSRTASERQISLANEGMYLLESLASAVSTSIELERGTGRFLRKWRSPSLLSSFAMMVIDDMEKGHRVRICPNCDIAFRSDTDLCLCDRCA